MAGKQHLRRGRDAKARRQQVAIGNKAKREPLKPTAPERLPIDTPYVDPWESWEGPRRSYDINQSPSYRSSMKDAGRGHLLGW